jgi:hypothetical protein
VLCARGLNTILCFEILASISALLEFCSPSDNKEKSTYESLSLIRSILPAHNFQGILSRPEGAETRSASIRFDKMSVLEAVDSK